MNSGLNYFAEGGVLDARKKTEADAAKLISAEFPNDENVLMSSNKIFEILQYKPEVVTAESIAAYYRVERAAA